MTRCVTGTDLVVDNCKYECCLFQDETLRKMLNFAVLCFGVCVPAQRLSLLSTL